VPRKAFQEPAAQFAELLERAGQSLPDVAVKELPEPLRAMADFGAGPFFGERMS
jgi:hypothetical protein